MKKSFDDKKIKGFTLIEIIVALAVFMILVTLGIGALLRIIDAHAKTQSLQLVMNNLNFTVESMSRHIRFGNNYDCDISDDILDSCIGGGEEVGIIFEGESMVYKLGTLDNEDGDASASSAIGSIWQKVGSESSRRLTSSEVDIEELKFYVYDTATLADGNDDQPRVTIVIEGRAGLKQAVSSDFVLQTTVNQRDNEEF